MIPKIIEALDPATAELIPPPPVAHEEMNDGNDPLVAGDLSSDLDASLRFAEAHAHSLRYCRGVGWLCWDGSRWAVDSEHRAIELAKQSARAWTKKRSDSTDENRNRKINEALTHENGTHIHAVVKLAMSDPKLSVKATDLDSNPMVMNVLNGTLDLRTGELLPHCRYDLITKISPVLYTEGASNDTFDRYLATCEVGKPGMSAFLARCFGTTLTGSAEAETLFLIQGDGGSGKTTLVEALAAMLGDYAVKLNFESLCQSKHGRSGGAASPDLVPLRGTRLAYASEGDASARLDAGKVKELTGNEPITVRALYHGPMTFLQTWKVFLVSNFDPKADSEDTGIWRRMAKLPFSVIPESQRDPAVKRLLMNDPQARSALLSWALAGCLDWQKRGGGRKGLAPPPFVEAATALYREKQDTLKDWWDELLDVATLKLDAFTPGKDLRSHYENWCDDNGATPVQIARFGTYLEKQGLVRKHTARARGWLGIHL